MAVTVHIKHLKEPCDTAAEETASVPSLPRLRSVQYTEVEERQKPFLPLFRFCVLYGMQVGEAWG